MNASEWAERATLGYLAAHARAWLFEAAAPRWRASMPWVAAPRPGTVVTSGTSASTAAVRMW